MRTGNRLNQYLNKDWRIIMTKFKGFNRIFSVLITVILIVQCMPGFTASAETINLHVWLSTEGMGDSPDFFIQEDWCYLCYELTDSKGNRINGYEDYDITMTIYNPDGSIRYEDYYHNSNNNWIASVMSDTGYFNCNVSVSGNIEVSCGVTGRVIPRNVDVKTWLSRTGMGKELDPNKEKFI